MNRLMRATTAHVRTTRGEAHRRHAAARCRRARGRAALAVILWLVAGAFAGGCELEYREISSGWDQFPQDPQPENPGEGVGLNAEGWTIVLHQFTGPARDEEASEMMRWLEQEARLGDLWIGQSGGLASVYRGRYADQRSARRALRRTQRVRVDGEQPLRNAVLAPLGSRRAAADDPLDLSQHSGQFSLQIGYFDEQFAGDRREAAEQVVADLREAGHEAYFYHGPHRSLVTLGVYAYEGAFVSRDDPRAPGATVDAYAPHIREKQQAFPYNLGNTLELLERQQGDQPDGDVQPSALVRVY